MWSVEWIGSTSPAPRVHARASGRSPPSSHISVRMQFKILAMPRLSADCSALMSRRGNPIAGIIGLAHAPMMWRMPRRYANAAEGEKAGYGRARRCWANRPRPWQWRHARKRGVGNFGQCRISSVWLSPSLPPIRPQRFDADSSWSRRALDGVALPVAKAEHFDVRKALQRPSQAGGGILPAGKQHQRGFGR